MNFVVAFRLPNASGISEKRNNTILCNVILIHRISVKVTFFWWDACHYPCTMPVPVSSPYSPDLFAHFSIVHRCPPPQKKNNNSYLWKSWHRDIQVTYVERTSTCAAYDVLKPKTFSDCDKTNGATIAAIIRAEHHDAWASLVTRCPGALMWVIHTNQSGFEITLCFA